MPETPIQENDYHLLYSPAIMEVPTISLISLYLNCVFLARCYKEKTISQVRL